MSDKDSGSLGGVEGPRLGKPGTVVFDIVLGGMDLNRPMELLRQALQMAGHPGAGEEDCRLGQEIIQDLALNGLAPAQRAAAVFALSEAAVRGSKVAAKLLAAVAPEFDPSALDAARIAVSAERLFRDPSPKAASLQDIACRGAAHAMLAARAGDDSAELLIGYMQLRKGRTDHARRTGLDLLRRCATKGRYTTPSLVMGIHFLDLYAQQGGSIPFCAARAIEIFDSGTFDWVSAVDSNLSRNLPRGPRAKDVPPRLMSPG